MTALSRRCVAALALLALLSARPAGAVVITIVNANDPGVGFNDPTPADPVGGNTGTTLGAQRLLAFEHAAALWGALLEGDVPIRITASFEPLECTSSEGTLGAAGPSMSMSDFDHSPLPGTWYPVALASQIAGRDLAAASAGHITAKFNSNLGTPGCLESSQWYYGLDNAHGGKTDLVAVLLHEFGHGLGFLTFLDPATGTEFLGKPDVFESLVLDAASGKRWDALTDAERKASAVQTGGVVWDGAAVTAAVPGTLEPLPVLAITAPPSLAGDVEIGTADFGAPLTAAGVSGSLVAASDAADSAGPATTDGCSAFDNAGETAGAVALIDRGTCNFTVKAANAQTAGAIGVVIVNNKPDTNPLGMAGIDPTIAIPVVSVTQASGTAMRGALAQGVAVTLGLDPDRRSGADAEGRMRLFAPNPVQDGSSISHWDSNALPHLLMQPNLAGDLPHAVDLTLPLLEGIGWVSASAPAPPAEPRQPVHRAGAEGAPRTVARP